MLLYKKLLLMTFGTNLVCVWCLYIYIPQTEREVQWDSEFERAETSDLRTSRIWLYMAGYCEMWAATNDMVRFTPYCIQSFTDWAHWLSAVRYIFSWLPTPFDAFVSRHPQCPITLALISFLFCPRVNQPSVPFDFKDDTYTGIHCVCQSNK